jgi:hypothetical protein
LPVEIPPHGTLALRMEAVVHNPDDQLATFDIYTDEEGYGIRPFTVAVRGSKPAP